MKKAYDPEKVSKFLSETAMGKRMKRSGFMLAGASDLNSLGDHIYKSGSNRLCFGISRGSRSRENSSDCAIS